jgi:hypothetical protein
MFSGFQCFHMGKTKETKCFKNSAPFRPFLGKSGLNSAADLSCRLIFIRPLFLRIGHCLQAAQRTDHREFVLFEPGKSGEQTTGQGSSGSEVPIHFLNCAEILEQSMSARNREEIGLSYRSARPPRLAESVPWINSWAP